MMRQDRGIQNPLKKKLSDWRRDAMEQKMIVDLTKTLYDGPLRLSKEYRSFVCNAQMSRYYDYDNDNEAMKVIVTFFLGILNLEGKFGRLSSSQESPNKMSERIFYHD